MGIMGFGLVFYDMEQHTIVPSRSHPVLKNMGYTSTVNAIIYRKRTNALCFAPSDEGVWFYIVKAGKGHVPFRHVRGSFRSAGI